MKYLGEKNHNVHNLISNNSIIKIMEKGAKGRVRVRERERRGKGELYSRFMASQYSVC